MSSSNEIVPQRQQRPSCPDHTHGITRHHMRTVRITTGQRQEEFALDILKMVRGGCAIRNLLKHTALQAPDCVLSYRRVPFFSIRGFDPSCALSTFRHGLLLKSAQCRVMFPGMCHRWWMVAVAMVAKTRRTT